jgi:hypothetical protein
MTGTSPTSLTLYFIADNPSIDHNRDLFTWAPSVEDALEDWQTNYETDDRPDGIFALPLTPPRGTIPWEKIRTEMLS